MGNYKISIICTACFFLVVLIFLSGCSAPVAPVNSSTHKLTYLTEQAPPYNYIKNGSVQGYAVDLIRDLAISTGQDASAGRFQVLTWNEAYQRALHEPDIVLFSMYRLPEREQLFQWVGPYESVKTVLFEKRGKNITVMSPGDLNLYTIAVIKDDAAGVQLKALGVAGSQIVVYPKTSDAIHALDNGSVDLWAYEQLAGDYLSRAETGRPGIFVPVYTINSTDLYYAFSLGTSPEIVRSFQLSLEEKQKKPQNGSMSEYERLRADYFPAEGLSTLRYYTEEFPPLNYRDNNELHGISIEILDAVMSYYKVNLTHGQVQVLPWSEGFDLAKKGPGTVLFSVARTPDREHLFKWAGPFASSSNAIFAARNRNISLQNSTALKNLRIGVIANTSSVTLLKDIGIPESSLVTGHDGGSMVGMLDSGEIDAWSTGEMTGMHFIRIFSRYPGQYEKVYRFPPFDYYYAFSPDTPDTLVEAFQYGIGAVRSEKNESGVTKYEEIMFRNIGVSCTRDPIQPEQVTSLVSYTANRISQDAKGTIYKINNGEAPYWDRDNPALYVYVYDRNVTLVAEADSMSAVGTNLKGKTDVMGNPFRDQIVERALENGTGWLDYIHINPTEQGIFKKSAYFQHVRGSDGNDYIVGAGMYSPCPGEGVQ